jgi:hypothetical protein
MATISARTFYLISEPGGDVHLIGYESDSKGERILQLHTYPAPALVRLDAGSYFRLPAKMAAAALEVILRGSA